ncbi:MAG: hypothetical protein IKL08_06975 [Clostridia bacterium]|nr:hypothetical protein [Clostridia bacterium]
MSRKDKREENKKHESKPKAKIVIKLPEFKGFTKKQIVTSVLIAVGLVIVLCIMNYSNLGLVLNKNITDDDVVKIDLISSNNKIYSYYNEVLIADTDKITTYNKYGRKTWEVKMQGAIDAKIVTNGKYLQIINTDKSIAYVFNDKYETAQIRVEGKIFSGNINSKGDSVIEYEASGNKKILAVYDKHGKAKYNVKLSSNTIGQYILSEDSKKLVYVDVNINGISVASSIKLVELKNDAKVVELASEENSLIYEMDLIGNKLVYRTDKNIVQLDINTKKEKRSSIEQSGVVSLDLDKNRYAYVEFNNGKYLLGIKNIGGKDKEEVKIKEMPKHYIYSKDKVYVCFQKEMYVYNNYKMRIKAYNSDMVITKPVILGEGNNIAFLVSNKLIIYTI